MKAHDIKPGIFVKGSKNGWIREILFSSQGRVAYADDFGGTGSCSLMHLASWAECEVSRPEGWVRAETDLIAALRAEGKLPEQGGVAPAVGFSKARSDLAKAIVLHAFRNTNMIENIHAGVFLPKGSKVVTADGKELPFEEVLKITDEGMKALMIEAVNKVYTILSFPHVQFRFSSKWNDAEPDQEMMAYMAMAGLFGEEAREEAGSKLESELESQLSTPKC